MALNNLDDAIECISTIVTKEISFAQIADKSFKEKNYHLERASNYCKVLAMLEELRSDEKQTIKLDVDDNADASASATAPRRKLDAFSKQIVDIFTKFPNPLYVDDVYQHHFDTFETKLSRDQISRKLSKMVDAGLLISVVGFRGLYRLADQGTA